MSGNVRFSFIVPVFNRPDELRDLLESFLHLNNPDDVAYEIIIADDGSEPPLKEVAEAYSGTLPVRYFYKKNSGPGDTRNRAMQQAEGEYFIILDSDILLPEDYLTNLVAALKKHPEADLAGGPDDAAASFSPFQKAVNLVMTSFLTTGGIRGHKKNVQKYVPRSFNMIVRREVFERTGGFGNIHPGEDPEWVYKSLGAGFRTVFFPDVKVFHKRRIDFGKFALQMKKFGITRYILNLRYPGFDSMVYRFPVLISLGWFLALPLFLLGFPWLLYAVLLHFAMIFVEFLFRSRSLRIALTALLVFVVQMAAYAYGYLLAFYRIRLRGLQPEIAFPELFF